MSLDLEDDLILSFDEDYVDEVAKRPVAASEPELVGEADSIPPEPTGKGEPSEKAKRTKAYKLVAPVGALFGRLAKRKLDALAASADEVKIDANDSPRRPEALLLKGVPISHLSTEKIFEYCAYYSSTSITQLEWVDDQSCVLVYEDPTMAAAAYNAIRKSADSEPADDLEMAICHPLPMSLWPAAERLAVSLGNQSSQGLKGPISTRWALKSDVKVRNARQQSKYYEKHGGAPLSLGRKRGRDDDEGESDIRGGSLRRRLDDPPDPAAGRARELAELDADLDRFAAGESFVDKNGTPLLEGREQLSAAGDRRRIAPLPGWRKGGRRKGPKSVPRPVADKDTLDAELDAFLERKD